MKTKRTMSSWKFKSVRREVRDRSIRLLLFLAIAAIASWFWATNAEAVLKTYHTDSGGDWICGSAVAGMTGILTDATTYACYSDSLSFDYMNDPPLDPLIGTWIMSSPYTNGTTITGQNLHFWMAAEAPGGGPVHFMFDIGYWANDTFTPLGSGLFDMIDPSYQAGEFEVDLSHLSGVIPAGNSLALRINIVDLSMSLYGSLHFGNNIGPGVIRFTVDEVNPPPTVSPIPDQSTYENNPMNIAFSISDAGTASDDLVVTATSDNQMLLPDSNIVLGGSGDNRTVTLTPVTDQVGSALVTIAVSDGVYSTPVNFTATWSPSIYVDVENTSGTEDGTLAHPFNTIQEGINAALPGALVQVADGTYTGVGNKNLILDGSIKNVTITSENGPETTIIDLEYSGRAFSFQGGSTSTLDGLKIINGAETDGGAIYVSDSSPNSPVITNCIFYNNCAARGGGAILVDLKGSAAPVISNCTFSNNSAASMGGALQISPTQEGLASVEIAKCTFSSNTSGEYLGGGGAISVVHPLDEGGYSDRIIIRENSFHNNIAYAGGAIFLLSDNAVVANCDFTYNQGKGRNILFFGIHETGGGAILAVGDNIQIANSVFFKNMGMNGGAIFAGFLQNPATSPVDIAHCTFIDNDVSFAGGAIYAKQSVNIYNSILWGNVSEHDGNQIYVGNRDGISGTINIGYCDLEGGLTAIDRSDDSNISVDSPGGIIDVNPKIVLDEDLHPMPDSPCIDAGDNASVPVDDFDLDNDGNTTEPLPYDADNNARMLDGNGDGNAIADIGAYEFDRTQSTVAAVAPTFFVFTAIEDGPVPEGQTLSVRNRGFNALASVNWTVNEEIHWLRVEPTTGDSSGETDAIRLYADQSGLEHGVYFGELQVTDDTGLHVFGTAQVIMYVTNELRVPSVYNTIQEAIYAAIEGDVVVVENGEYAGPGNMEIDFLGKEITVKSENGPDYTVINCDGDGRAFHFKRAETNRSIIQGFTIKRGVATAEQGYRAWGGGVKISGASSPTILNCTFEMCSANEGGGIHSSGPGTFIGNCTFRDNSAGLGSSNSGGAMAFYGADFTIIKNCQFLRNTTLSEDAAGGAISIGGGFNFTIQNSQFMENTTEGPGGAISFGSGESGYLGTISACVFSNNSAGNGGGIFLGSSNNDARLDVQNCVFSDNAANTSGGAIFCDAADVSYCTFYSNERGTGGQGGGIYVGDIWDNDNTGTTKITNSILWDNEPSDDIYNGPGSTINLSHCTISDSSWIPSGTRIIDDNPLFIDPDGPDDILGNEDDDFRLDPTSTCIDAGKKIQWLFSDIRGSLRPVDITNMPRDAAGDPVTQDSPFDIGAYEFSEDYGGIEGDLTTKAFKDLKIGGSLVVTNFDYEIKWKDKNPFAFDTRISHAGEYDVNLALVSDEGLRIDLGTHTVEVSQHGYSISYTFGPEHIGTWRIKLELVSDPNQFVLSDEFSIEYKEATRYALGQRIQPPDGADSSIQPDVDEEDACYWSVETNRLYAIAPITTVVTWYGDEARTMPFPVVAYITYPDPNNPEFPLDPDVYIHVANTMAVNLLPEGSPFDLAEIMYAGNDATISANTFQAGLEGWAVLMYRDQQAADPDEKEVFDVVRTYVWDHEQDPEIPSDLILNPDFPIESSPDIGTEWDIGTEISDGEHCAGCDSGYVFFENARYDAMAYDRETRQGPIFAVNEDDPATEKNDLVVVWYKASAASGVHWPSKPVRYNAVWPDDAQKIVIASQLGSGPLDPETYGTVENMLIYNQSDRAQPGYNANEEHAAFFAPPDALYPAVFALRTDLNKPADDATPYASGDRSRPYVLLKYLDPNTDAWAFEVFEVLAESRSYMMVPLPHPPFPPGSLAVGPDDGSDTRYYIDEVHNLIELTGVLPETAYYFDVDGHLVNHSDGSVSAEEYYLDVFGQLITLSGDLPSDSYSLDINGVIVESDVYYTYHFYYAATAGEEITPPYPLSQPAFGPCFDSYTSTATSILKDKSNRFLAKHGGFNGAAAEDGIINYFYRLQPGFFYDLDDNGVADEIAGTCIPWLGVVDGTTEGAPADITYALTWPDVVPTLYVGETLTDAKIQEGETVGLPNVADQCVVDVLFDQSVAEGGGPSAKLVDPLSEHAVALDEVDLPSNLNPQYGSNNRMVFKALPEYLQSRLTYDYLTSELKLRGDIPVGMGEPLLLLNTLTQRDIMEISRPFLPDPSNPDPEHWTDTVIPINFRNALYSLKSAGDAGLTGASVLKDPEMKAITAGDAQAAPSYVTVAFNNDTDCPGAVTLSVIKVDCPLYLGEIKVIESDDAFEEKVTLHHNGDFGGNSDNHWFQWKQLTGFSGIPEGPGEPGENWAEYSDVLQVPETVPRDDLDPDSFFQGAVDVTVQGTDELLLSDRWFSMRYYHEGVCSNEISDWTEPQLYEGWVKRVMKKINRFDQKVKDFQESDVNTLASMISLAGERYEADVLLSDDPDNLNKLGIIETYQTLLNRLKGLTIDQGIDNQESNDAILFAVSRIAGLYLVEGNEAYGDGTDPTIGFSTEDGQYGHEAPSIFCFQNQADSLLEEELVLLRGRAEEGVRPFYNRFVWNLTEGDGAVAYKESYNITDQETDQDGDGVPDAPDGVIDERDAMVLYPQGHGDAWGHYLTASKYYYDLLKHPSFTWIPNTEAILIDQVPVDVDYRDERQFAKAAAAKAKTGSEIVNLTYRQNYVEDPESQWQGYKDADTDRAWGVDGWSRRAGQGALFDWLVGNAILPAEDTDTDHEGIAKVDRTTVVELREVASQYAAVQAEIDRADVGLNPLGLAKNAVPFDIDPGGIDNGQTHFEQIYDRAVQAMNNAIAVFNHANQSTMLLRRQQDTLADFKRNIENTEADFNNRLIEVFGYPYPDDDAYSPDYCQTGPDLYHYMYVEPSELMGVEAPRVHEFTATFKDIDVDASGALQETEQSVQFHVDTDNRFGLIKPPEWQGRRKAPGEIQLARSDLLQARGRFEKALVEYDNLLGHIEKQADLIEAQHQLNADEIMILNRAKGTQETLNSAIRNSRSRQLLYRSLGSSAVILSNALAEAWPTNTGVIAGLAGGVIFDATSGIRSGIKLVGQGIDKMMSGMADLESLAELDHQHAKEIVSAQTNIQLTALRGDFAVEQQLLQLENLIRTETTLRLEIYNLSEGLQQSAGRYLASLARGERLLQDRLRFRKQTAAQIQDYRYKDMTFRIFRNDALQKYRAQFDLAAMYVYLAAKAYDYETTLLDYDSMAGQAFFTDIVKQRTIGMIEDGQPLTGQGLADPMKRMWQNFQVLKPQLGFNNPQEETNRFSMRREFFRIMMDEGSTDTWRQVLDAHRVDDLWDIPEFRRHCRPFADEGMPQPGIVIPFSTTVTSGLNFFEWPLGGNDSYYSATNFATKVRSVGVWFSNYNSVQLAQTPRIYLVPVGEDVLRTPSSYTRDIRTWHVVDQKLPVPFPIVGTELENNPGWIPTVDTIFDEMFQVRRHSDFRAYHDSGYVNESEMTFDSRLVGRSVWNTGWLLIIPGQNLLYDADEGLDRFIHGPEVIGGTGERTGNGVWDIKLFFHTYAYSGN